MAEYVVLLISTCALVGAVCAVSPRGAKKHVRLLCSLCLLCIIVSPLASIEAEDIFGDIGIYEEGAETDSVYSEIYSNTVRAVNEDRISSALKEILVRDLSLDAESLSVSVRTEENGGVISVTEVSVGLSGKNILAEPESIIGYVEEMLECKCEIVYY